MKKVISSNEREYLNGEGKKELEMILDQVDGEGKSLGKMYLTQKLQGTNFRMVGVIDPDFAFIQQYHLKSNILLTLGITVLIGLFVFIFIKQQTRPLSKLADKMRLVQEGNMQEYVDVEGTEEIQELSKAYNYDAGANQSIYRRTHENSGRKTKRGNSRIADAD